MRLCESVEEDFIEQANIMYRAYKQFDSEVSMLDTISDGDNAVELETSILRDFSTHELSEKIKNVVNAFLDEYYPINYGDDEEDSTSAREVYRRSLEKRQEIEDMIYSDK